MMQALYTMHKDLKQEVSSMKRSDAELQDSIVLENRISFLKRKLEFWQNTAKQNVHKIAQLELDVEDRQDTIDALQANKEAMREELDANEAELDDNEIEIQELRASLARSRKNFQDSTKAIDTYCIDVDRLTDMADKFKQFEELKNAEVESLKTKLTARDEEIKNLKQKIAVKAS